MIRKNCTCSGETHFSPNIFDLGLVESTDMELTDGGPTDFLFFCMTI